jgi:hypothetical protein
MEFVRRIDIGECTELEAKMEIDALRADIQALRAALELVTSEATEDCQA